MPDSTTGEWSTAGCALPRTAQSTTVGGVAMPVTPAALGAAMARIDSGGRAEFVDSYAGLEVDQQSVRAIVYRVPSPAFDDFVRDSARDTCIVVRDAAYPLAELHAWQQRLTADLSRWAERGVRITSVGARHDGSGVQVGAADVARARRALLDHYGAAAPLIVLHEGPVRRLET